LFVRLLRPADAGSCRLSSSFAAASWQNYQSHLAANNIGNMLFCLSVCSDPRAVTPQTIAPQIAAIRIIGENRHKFSISPTALVHATTSAPISTLVRPIYSVQNTILTPLRPCCDPNVPVGLVRCQLLVFSRPICAHSCHCPSDFDMLDNLSPTYHILPLIE
jgi:hypothetical protein